MAIRVFDFSAGMAAVIPEFDSRGAASVELAHGDGEAYAYAIHIEPGGVIGPHHAGFDQLYLVVRGSGWVAGADGVRHAVGAERGAFIPTGEEHSKGSDVGMLAIMVQAGRWTVAAPPAAEEA